MGCESKNSDAVATALREGLTAEFLVNAPCVGYMLEEGDRGTLADLQSAIVSALVPVVERLLADYRRSQILMEDTCRDRDAALQRAAEAERRLREIREKVERDYAGLLTHSVAGPIVAEVLALLDTRAGQGEK